MHSGFFGRKRAFVLGVASILAVILLWQAVAVFVVSNPFHLPSFTDVLSEFIYLLGEGSIPLDIATSLYHFLLGLVAALILGVPIGMMMGWFDTADMIANPIIEILRPIPPLAWIPFAIIWFGLTAFSAGFIVFVGAFFPILINTYAGFSSVPRVYVEAGKVLGCASETSLIRYIALPASLPSIVTGIRIATGVGWMCLVAAEIFGSSKHGLGMMLWQYYNLHNMSAVVVYMLILGLIGLMFDIIFRRYVDEYLLSWREGEVS